MDPAIYKLIHFISIIGLFLSLGWLVGADGRKPAALRVPTILHGVSLLLILVSGLGMQAKLEIKFLSFWIIAKLILWLGLGACLVLAKRQVLSPLATWGIILVIGSIAAYLGFSNSVLTKM